MKPRLNKCCETGLFSINAFNSSFAMGLEYVLKGSGKGLQVFRQGLLGNASIVEENLGQATLRGVVPA